MSPEYRRRFDTHANALRELWTAGDQDAKLYYPAQTSGTESAARNDIRRKSFLQKILRGEAANTTHPDLAARIIARVVANRLS